MLIFSRSALVCAVAILAAMPGLSMASAAPTPSHLQLVQDEGVPDEDAVPTDQVDKYIAVYSAMQKNHSLSVEQAASKQGLTVDQFRTLEDKIERNPIVHQRVLDALKASSSNKVAGSATKSK